MAVVTGFRTQVFVVCLLAAAPLYQTVPPAQSAAGAIATESHTRSGLATVGEAAPWLAGWTLDDQIWNLRKAFADTAVIRVALVFFATWCAPCKQGITQLSARAADMKEGGVAVVLVDLQEDAAKVRDFLGDEPKYPVVLDRFSTTEQTYLRTDSEIRLPRTVLIDRDLKVQAIFGSEGDDYVDRILSGR